jgi:xylan 1,4-beta-xylosidase
MRFVLLLLAPIPAIAQDVEIRVDAAKTLGKVQALHGVNGGPLAMSRILDLSDRFREFRPPLIRLHDCRWPNPDVIDMHVVFPDPKADPEKAESYDFARTDEYLAAIADVGSGIVFRLGESIEHGKIRKHVHPPRDPAKWAAACVGIIRHCNEGWANGSKLNIRYWEIWNEPDNRPAMWSGTDEDYFALYAASARAIKKRFPDVKVGGPGLGNSGALKDGRLEPSPMFRKFLDFCRRESLPLDFFSWHAYGADPRELAQRAKEVRRILDDGGVAHTDSHLNEWNYLPNNDWHGVLDRNPLKRRRWHEELGGPAGAAFVASVLTQLQDAQVDAANYFSAEPQGMGLFDAFGVPKKTFHAMRLFNKMATDGTRLEATSSQDGVVCLASKSKSANEVFLLLSRQQGQGGRATVRIDSLPWKEATSVEMVVIDERSDGQPGPRSDFRDGTAIPLGSPSVVLLRFTPSRGKR